MIMLNFSVCIILVLAFNQALNASSLAIERQNDVIYDAYNGDDRKEVGLELASNVPVEGNFESNENEKNSNSIETNESWNQRDKRRLNVFKNVYNRCLIQKTKDKDLCLYIAHLFHHVKGMHGF